MIDQKTPYLQLPLPHPENELEDDIYRLRDALGGVDHKLALIDATLSSDDETLDTVQELVLAIKENRADIEGMAAISDEANAAKIAAQQAASDAQDALDATTAVANRYIDSPTMPPNPPAGVHPLWWDGSVMRVWDGTTWTDASSSVSGLRQVFHYTLAAGQDTIAGPDDNGAVLVFDRAAYIDVFLNGSRIVLAEDFTADAVSQSLELATPGQLGDEIVVVSYTNLTMVDADFDTVFVQKTDSRLTNAREWNAATVPKAEAEGGEATTRRAWTAARVRQAIVAWWDSITSAFGRSFVAVADAAAGRTALGLGTAATAASSAFLPSFSITTTGASKTIAAFEHVTVTAAGQTITLPASPTPGTQVKITVLNFTNTTVARNGKLLMGLSENMTITRPYITLGLVFVGDSQGWRFA